MRCLNTTLKMMIKGALAFPTIKPNPIPPYNGTASPDTPLMNKACLILSVKRLNFPKNESRNYMCLCMETPKEMKTSIEESYNLINRLKKEQSPVLKRFSEIFVDVAKYLEAEFKKQDRIFKFLSDEIKKDPAEGDCPIASFVVGNLRLSFDEFYSRYSRFLVNHYFRKFKRDFDELKDFNISELLKNELHFIYCQGMYAYKQGDLKNNMDAIESINKAVLTSANLMVKIVS